MKAKLAKEVGATFRDSGFFHSINHCIPKEPTETVTENLKLFFHQPLEEKMKVQLDLTHPVSYNSNDFTNNVRDWVEIYNYLLKDKIEVPVTHELEATRIMQLHNHGPACPPGFQKTNPFSLCYQREGCSSKPTQKSSPIDFYRVRRLSNCVKLASENDIVTIHTFKKPTTQTPTAATTTTVAA
ncbi:uncharacterized protein LOC18446767 isoform X1 [Amborella trichopoda]|uniref:uncharacterized protein LOC18446767 isoform X1 n=1 Tax=Amborella trichopoda TaxID=13333 RepID=UPI0009BFEEAD|nr:uncharacterized protein LOC18446767 isoform X1 [Amborella trichopoda]|eukprot:XP_020530788.1 uncharacterized protein LOC18446767 isoform X1 [Amborella trichopoda]